jgi:hypothetical protein
MANITPELIAQAVRLLQERPQLLTDAPQEAGSSSTVVTGEQHDEGKENPDNGKGKKGKKGKKAKKGSQQECALKEVTQDTVVDVIDDPEPANSHGIIYISDCLMWAQTAT